MKYQFVLFNLLFVGNILFSQWDGNTTPTYTELISQCETWANRHAEIELYNMGTSDYGLPIYLLIVNGEGDSTKTFLKAKNHTTLLVNNAIHAGEPDGINAMLFWVQEWIEKGKKTKNLPVIAFIPAYNVGGMMNRSATSRANQDGPAEYGFRGNAQNLDLNRDFIKMDSKNAFTFSTIFHSLNPDIFIDNHVTNGADYQPILTLISSMKERLAPSIEQQTYCEMIPSLKKSLLQSQIDLVPYVDLIKDIPDSGIVAFNDLPRYAMGYASLFHCFSFTVETHMLKPFSQRVQATRTFFEEMVEYCVRESVKIEKAREDALLFQKKMDYYPFNYELNISTKDSIQFKGFTAKYKKSLVTGLDRLYYDRSEPWTKKIPFYQTHVANDSVAIPKFYVVAGQAQDVIERLQANGVEMKSIVLEQTVEAYVQKIVDFQSPKAPYEGHFLHTQTKMELVQKTIQLKKGDFLISTDQDKAKFLHATLLANSEDSYFNWNFFDSYLDQKEYFSPYVFEEIAAKMLEENEDLRTDFESQKALDPNFSNSQWQQLYFLYKRSPYFETSFRLLPVYLVY